MVSKQLDKLYRQEVEDTGESGAWWLAGAKKGVPSEVQFSAMPPRGPGKPAPRDPGMKLSRTQ